MDTIEITNLSFGYTKDLVLEGVELKVGEGELVCLVGENGSGKSTLLKVLLGELKKQSGSVKVLGENIEGACNFKDVGYVPQVNVVNKISFPITCRELVALGLYREFGAVKIPRKAHYRKTEEHLESMGLGSLARKPFNQLSGGLQQRVMITRAMINGPKLLILDEPTAGVDLASKEKLFELLESLHTQGGITILLVSHEVDFVKDHATVNNTYRIENRRIVHA